VNDNYVRVEILGQTYWFRSEDKEVDAQEVVSYIKRKIKEDEELYNNLPPQKAMVLMIMNIAKDFVVVQKRLDELQQYVIELTKKIENIIDVDSEIAQKER